MPPRLLRYGNEADQIVVSLTPRAFYKEKGAFLS